MGAQTAARGGMYDPKYLIMNGYAQRGTETRERRRAYVTRWPNCLITTVTRLHPHLCNSVRNVLKTYGASANQAILNAFSYKLKGKAYENFMNDAANTPPSRRRSNSLQNDISTAEAPTTS